VPKLGQLRLDELMPQRRGCGPQRDRPGESQTAARQERRVLVRRPLAPADVYEHLEIGVQNQHRLVGIGRKVSLHEDETRIIRHGPAATRQDGDRLIVVPVVDDVTQDVGVTAGGHRVEEAPSDELAAVDDTDLLEDLPGVLDDVRLVEEDATQSGVPFEDRREKPAASASDVDHHVHLGEVIRRGDEARMVGRVAEHARIEGGPDVRMTREVFEETRSVGVVERGLSGAHRVQHVAPWSPVRFGEREQDRGPDRARNARTQQSTHRRQSEALCPDLVEHSDPGQE
jgi:hypothetical protein